jgi:hypothetical protein
MWFRPDYVAILGQRPGLPMYYRWSVAEFLGEVQRSKADYIVASSLLKADLDGGDGNPAPLFNAALQVGAMVHAVPSLGANGHEVAVLKIDHGAVDGMLNAGRR